MPPKKGAHPLYLLLLFHRTTKVGNGKSSRERKTGTHPVGCWLAFRVAVGTAGGGVESPKTTYLRNFRSQMGTRFVPWELLMILRCLEFV